MPSKKKSKAKRAKSKTAKAKNKTLPRKSKIKGRAGKTRSPQTRKSSKRGARTRTGSVNAAREIEQEIQNRNLTRAAASRKQSDFRGLSRAEEADSESIDELVEEGNVFEAGAVAGVEEADNADEREVVTHELPEDDVPEEYLDKE